LPALALPITRIRKRPTFSLTCSINCMSCDCKKRFLATSESQTAECSSVISTRDDLRIQDVYITWHRAPE
jgi:hypothetical protein